MLVVVSAHYIKEYRIWCEFNNGKSGIVNLEPELWGPAFKHLKDIDEFKNFHVSTELGTICWGNTADFAPEFLYNHLE